MGHQPHLQDVEDARNCNRYGHHALPRHHMVDSQLSKRATACTIRMQIFKQIKQENELDHLLHKGKNTNLCEGTVLVNFWWSHVLGREKGASSMASRSMQQGKA